MELMLALIAVELYFVMIFLWNIKRELINLNKKVEFFGQHIGSDVHISKMFLKIISEKSIDELIKKEDGEVKND